MRSLAASLALLVATLLLCALLGEGVLRLVGAHAPFGPTQRFRGYRPSAALSHELRPSWQGRLVASDFDMHVATNALGLRGPEVDPLPPSARTRILVVGDSFAFGWGVNDDETFSAVLERELRGAGLDAEVLDAGVPGWAADQYWIYLRERGFGLRPDLVLLAVCGNDTEELAWKDLRLGPERLPIATTSRRHFINRRGEMRFLNDSLLALPEAPLPGAVRDWLHENSWAYRWLRIRAVRAWAGGVAALVQAGDALAPDDVPTGPPASLATADISRGLQGSAEFRLRYHRFLVERIAVEASARGVAFRSLLTEDAEPGLRSDCAAASHCLDQKELFDRRRDPDTYLPVDGHWSREGHRRLGEALARWLRESGAI